MQDAQESDPEAELEREARLMAAKRGSHIEAQEAQVAIQEEKKVKRLRIEESDSD